MALALLVVVLVLEHVLIGVKLLINLSAPRKPRWVFQAEARAAFQAEAAEKAMAQREAESAKQTATPAGGLRRRQPSAAPDDV